MKALLDWIDAVPPLTMGQFVVIVVPFLVGQTFVFLLAFLGEPHLLRRTSSRRQKGGPDGA
ncbi:MAG: hypothetical protein ACK4M8_02080 [Allorhizobium sp.]